MKIINMSDQPQKSKDTFANRKKKLNQKTLRFCAPLMNRYRERLRIVHVEDFNPDTDPAKFDEAFTKEADHPIFVVVDDNGKVIYNHANRAKPVMDSSHL